MGFFSWKTQDTKRSIVNKHSDISTFEVTMVNPLTGDKYVENDYDGYGVFGNKDYYELLAEMNGKSTREDGIDIAYGEGEYVSPLLLEDATYWTQYKGTKPVSCPEQGYFFANDEEDDDYDWDDENCLEDDCAG